ncbi:MULTISPECIES: hypothetical protein [Deinococcus]|uniref:Uncharacterized protein n=1 Tax=Deinococcus rufus TaxID=2136097 RepID=A0ABV7ZB59_9DEIO|nr:hypothetical protein [Deinococcus sp. AB2017081]WQE94204.1 hypothetical protein U2P90_12375 [Deinococcus sp. AB2017081]
MPETAVPDATVPDPAVPLPPVVSAVPPQDAGASPIARAIIQGAAAERRNADLDTRTRELRYRELVDQRLLRLLIGLSVFGVSVLWLVADVTLTLGQGFGTLFGQPFRLDPTIIIAFLTTSTATVIGLFLVFLRWLYPSGSGRGEGRDG